MGTTSGNQTIFHWISWIQQKAFGENSSKKLKSIKFQIWVTFTGQQMQ